MKIEDILKDEVTIFVEKTIYADNDNFEIIVNELFSEVTNSEYKFYSEINGKDIWFRLRTDGYEGPVYLSIGDGNDIYVTDYEDVVNSINDYLSLL